MGYSPQSLEAYYASALAYVEWITLGPGLTEGNWLIGTEHGFREVARASGVFHGQYSDDFWEGPHMEGVLVKFFGAREKVGRDSRSAYVPPRFTDRALALSKKIAGGSFEDDIVMSYFIGVLNAKKTWDPPECSSSAVNILRRSRRNAYGRVLADNTISSNEIRSLRPAHKLVKAWADQEKRLRNGLPESLRGR